MPHNEVQPLKNVFGAASMNDHTHSHLWVDGAAQFIPRINDLLAHQKYLFRVLHMDSFQNPEQDKLGHILMNNRSDKSTTHNYNILYSYIFSDLGKDRNLNVLEVGMGTNNPDLVSSMGSEGRPGASLYSFAEYLPNAAIYGADIDKNILFQSDRIKTYFVDQMNPQTFCDLGSRIGNVKFDLIIDDGLHSIGANINTLLFALDSIADNGWIVIEDIGLPDNWRAIDFVLKHDPRYDAFMLKSGNGYQYENSSHMYVVHKVS
jgi:hypothetical protein